jgi:squalene-hopene/tetraprenyl-beta-curcumene cyclase
MECDMEQRLRHAVVILAFVLEANLPANKAMCDDAPVPSWSAQAAASYLDERADWWLNWSQAARGQGTACISCHTALPVALARTALSEPLGEAAAGMTQQRLIDNVTKRVAHWEKIASESASGDDPFRSFYSDRVPASLGTEAVLNALVLANHDLRRAKGVLSAPAHEALRQLWEQQQQHGAWLWLDFGLNPWESDGEYYGASLAAVAVGMAGKDYYERADVQANVAALGQYLRTKSPHQPLHHRALALWASSWLPGVMDETDQRRLVEELWNAQEADGGWSLAKLGKIEATTNRWETRGVFPEGSVSDGYATGLVVLACKSTGVKDVDAKLKKGSDWLRANQRDGTWPATYLNARRDPHNDVGKFMRDAATAFAILALTQP